MVRRFPCVEIDGLRHHPRQTQILLLCSENRIVLRGDRAGYHQAACFPVVGCIVFADDPNYLCL
jgi:hypothetical protein